jgi:hypothetical protein
MVTFLMNVSEGLVIVRSEREQCDTFVSTVFDGVSQIVLNAENLHRIQALWFLNRSNR